MKGKILYCASTSSHIKNFHLPYIEFLHKSGYLVDVLCDGEIHSDFINKLYNLKLNKSLNIFSNMNAIFEVIKIFNKSQYDLISVHTTLAAGICRLSKFLAFKDKSKLIYTCHGYLFTMHGKAKKLFQILCEKILSFKTDGLIVMNEEDWFLANKYRFCKNIYMSHGMGIDKDAFRYYSNGEIAHFKNTYGKRIVSCIAEFSHRKNQTNLIKALPLVLRKFPDCHFVFAGSGKEFEPCKKLVKELNLEKYVSFLGQYDKVDLLLHGSELVVSPSKCEGLPFNIMEAMFFHKKIAASDIKGHRDLLSDFRLAKLFDCDDTDAMASAIMELLSCNEKSDVYLKEEYQLNRCMDEIMAIYGKFCHIPRAVKIQ